MYNPSEMLGQRPDNLCLFVNRDRTCAKFVFGDSNAARFRRLADSVFVGNNSPDVAHCVVAGGQAMSIDCFYSDSGQYSTMTESLTTTPVLARFVWSDTSWQCTLIDDRAEPQKVLYTETCPTSTEAYFKCERWASENGFHIYRTERSRSELSARLSDSEEDDTLT